MVLQIRKAALFHEWRDGVHVACRIRLHDFSHFFLCEEMLEVGDGFFPCLHEPDERSRITPHFFARSAIPGTCGIIFPRLDREEEHSSDFQHSPYFPERASPLFLREVMQDAVTDDEIEEVIFERKMRA